MHNIATDELTIYAIFTVIFLALAYLIHRKDKKMTTRQQIDAINAYNKQNTLMKAFRLNKKTEPLLIAWLSKKKFTTYVKELVVQDMMENGAQVDERFLK